MFFDSTAYLVFLVLVVAPYWRLKPRGQNLFLLPESYCFYGGWDWRFLFLMERSMAGGYLVARRTKSSPDARERGFHLNPRGAERFTPRISSDAELAP